MKILGDTLRHLKVVAHSGCPQIQQTNPVVTYPVYLLGH